MSNIHDSQESNAEPQHEPSYMPVMRPKGIWLISLLLFLMMSMFFSAGKRYFGFEDGGQATPALKIFSAAFLLALFLMLHGIIYLKPLVIKIVIGVFAVTALFGAFQFTTGMLQESRLYLGTLVIRVIPPVLAIWYLARRSFMELAKRYNANREQELMNKYIRKQLLKR